MSLYQNNDYDVLEYFESIPSTKHDTFTFSIFSIIIFITKTIVLSISIPNFNV